MSMTERWDLLDEQCRLTGKTMLRGQPVPPGYYYRFVHVFVRNSAGQLLVQKRSQTKKSFPGTWAVTGGAVIAGETSREAAGRELAEEMGIRPPLTAFHFVDRIRLAHAFLDIWSTTTELTIDEMVLQPDEVDAARFVSPAEFVRIATPGSGRHAPAYQLALTRYLRREGLLGALGERPFLPCTCM